MTKTIFQYHLLKNSFLEKTKNCSLQIPQNYSTLFELSTPEAKRSLGEQKVINPNPTGFWRDTKPLGGYHICTDAFIRLLSLEIVLYDIRIEKIMSFNMYE